MTYTKEQGKQKIGELVDRFRANIAAYKKSTYNEAQVRLEFINPFFEALGWDVSNKQGYAEQYKEVVHEDTIKVGRSTRAPDYSFRVGGQRKFFVEAKKPAVNIKEDVSPSYQLRRYAWSAKLPLSIVTDFEELSVFNCQIKPNPTDKPSIGRIAYYTFDEYLDKFDEIYSIFSKEAILKGSFDRYAQSTKGKKGTAEVDREFLKEIESWREMLAKNIALRNPDVSIHELNYAVQKIIDRIIFLRICEDRGIEHYGQLQTRAEGDKVYTHLLNHFKLAESKYNSGIFDFDADKITPSLHIDDKVLKTIIPDLYYPKSPYEFSVFGVEILGNVYEQFLGKVIRLTAGHQAKVETKPEVKKAGGVYYTPQYIVEYIVENTVGKLVEGKTPDAIAEIRILDPACGSGSFLIGAYSYLLRYHLDWYVNNKPKKHKKNFLGKSFIKNKEAIFQVRENEWYLTTAEKKRILLDNIFGVDIDPQAVEVTKMSLLLKVLEHESRENIDQQAKLGLEGVLPNLGDNIKCGNSLIGPGYYETVQETLFDEEEMRRVNVFDWEDERKGFGEIMRKGGFDCAIGNPPYVSIELTRKDVTEFYLKTYKSAYGRVNTFSLFIEKAISLLKKNGNCGLIISNRILTNTQLTPLRKLLLENCEIKSILSFKKNVFGVAVDTAVITFQRKTPSQEQTIEIWYNIIDLVREKFEVNTVLQSTFLENQSYVFNVKQMEKFKKIIQKVREKSIPLEKVCDVKDGIILGAIKDLLLSDTAVDDRYEKWLDGGEVARYSIEWSGRYILYATSLVEEELKRKQKKAKETAETPSDFKKLSRPGIWLRSPEIFKQPKILTRQNAKRLIGVLDEDNYFVKNSLHCTLLKDKTYNLKYLLGLINSKAMDFYFQEQVGSTGEIFSQMKITYLKKLPIRTIDFSNPAEKAQHDKLVALVDNMLKQQKKYHDARMEQDKELYERQIKIVDAQIDRLVYDLYELTEEEIRIVEEE